MTSMIPHPLVTVLLNILPALDSVVISILLMNTLFLQLPGQHALLILLLLHWLHFISFLRCLFFFFLACKCQISSRLVLGPLLFTIYSLSLGDISTPLALIIKYILMTPTCITQAQLSFLSSNDASVILLRVSTRISYKHLKLSMSKNKSSSH